VGPADIIVVVVYLVGIAALGIYQQAKVKSSGDYFTGGRKFSKWLMVMHALGTGTHADDPVGVTGACYQRGMGGIWWTYIYLFATPFYWVMAPFFRRSRYVTTSDFFRERYSNALGVLYTVMGLLIFAVNTGTLLKGTGTIVQAVTGRADWEAPAIVLMTVVFVAYGFAGGLIATVITESVQGVLIVVMSLLLVPFGLAKLGGFHGLHGVLNAGMFSLAADQEVDLQFAIIGTIGMVIGIAGQPHIMEVCSTGKTEYEGRVGFTYGNFAKRFCAMGWALAGLIVAGMVAQGMLAAPAAREDAFGLAIRELLPPGATGLMFAAILAAQMSTLSAFMVAGSALFTRNVYKQYLARGATDAQQLRVGRVAGLIVVVFGVALSLTVESVVDALTIFMAMAAWMGVLIWFGALWKRATRKGAWVSFITMMVIWLFFGKIGAMVGERVGGSSLLLSYLGAFAAKEDTDWLFAIQLAPGIALMVIGSMLTRPEDPERLRKFFRLIHTPVGKEHELEEAGIETVYMGEREGHPWELQHGRAVNVIGFALATVFAIAVLGILYGLARIGT